MKILLIFLLATLSYGVATENFKKCIDLGFCTRSRELSSPSGNKIVYFVPYTSIQRAEGGITFYIQTVFDPSPFLIAKAWILSSGILHLTIDEISPLRPRYKILELDLINPDYLQALPFYSISADSVTFELNSRKYIINLAPFEILGYLGNKLVYKLNERKLMNFERYKHSTFTGEFDEHFREWTDNNPHGPSSVGIDMTFFNTSNIYGIPEHASTLSLGDTLADEPYRLYNLDVCDYNSDSKMALYGSIPYIISLNGGIFWNNPSETFIDIYTNINNKQTHWFSETGVIDIYLFLEEDPLEIVKKFTLLTGPPSFPPLFSFGYHQSRWNYYTQFEVQGLLESFDINFLPVDVIWLDIEHTDDKKYFTWNLNNFPDPKQLINKISISGKKLVTIVDPHVRLDGTYQVFNGLQKLGI